MKTELSRIVNLQELEVKSPEILAELLMLKTKVRWQLSGQDMSNRFFMLNNKTYQVSVVGLKLTVKEMVEVND